VQPDPREAGSSVQSVSEILVSILKTCEAAVMVLIEMVGSTFKR